MADKCTNLLSPGPQGKAYIKNWSKLCCYETPTTTYEEFVQQVDEEYTASCTKDKLFYDYSTKLFQQCFSGGSGGMTSFTVEGDNGTPFTITNGDTLDFEGSTGIDIGVSDPKVLVAIDYSGVDSFIMAAANGTSITVDGANDKLVIYDNDAAEVKYINANQLPGATTKAYWTGTTNGNIGNSGLTDTKVGIGTDTPNEQLTVVGEISGTSNLHIGGDILQPGVNSIFNNGSYLEVGTGFGNSGQLTFNANHDGGVSTNTYTPVFAGNVNAGMTVIKMPSGGYGGLDFYVKNHGTTSGSQNLSTFTKILELNQDGNSTFGGSILLGDGSVSDTYAGFGNNADLKIFHNGSHSIVRETGTGNLYLQSDNNVILSKDSSTEAMVKGIADGAVELYHDNVKKLETRATGVFVPGTFSASTKVISADILGTNTVISSGKTYIGQIDAAGAGYTTDKILVAQADGEVEYLTKEQLRQDISAGYWSGNTDGTISNSGLTQTNVGVGTDKPNEELTVVGTISATTNVKIGTTANHLTVSNQYIRHKNSNRIFFSSAPSTSAPNLLYDYWGMPDNDHFYWGTDEDLDIYHSGSQGYIDNDTGTLNILSSTVKLGDTTSETIVNDNLQVNDDLTVNTDNLYVDSNNGKTGVKTLAPDAILTVSGCTGAGGSWTTWAPSDGLTSFALIQGNLFASYAPADAEVPTPLTQQGTTIRILVDGVAYYGTTAEIGSSGSYGWSSSRAYFSPVWAPGSVTITNADELAVIVAYGGPLPCEEPLFKVWKGQTPAFQVSATTNTPGFEVMSGSTNMLDVMRTHDSYVTGATFSSPILTLSRNQGLPDITTSLYNNTTNLFWTGNSTNIVNSGLTTTKVGIGTDTPNEELTVVGDVSTTGTLYVASKVEHLGDNDTYIQFADDSIGINAGGEQLITISESPTFVKIGDGGDVDFQVRTNSDDNTLYVLGSTDKVGIGTNTPNEKLTVVGTISGNTNVLVGGRVGVGVNSPSSALHITTSDNVIVKVVSTDSIATIELGDNSTSNQAILTRVSNDLKICKDGGNVGLPISPKTKLDVQHNPTSLSNNTGGGESVTFGTEDGTDTLTAGKLMYLNSSGVWKYADASAASTSTNLLAIALGTAVSDGLLIRGFFDFYISRGCFCKRCTCLCFREFWGGRFYSTFNLQEIL